MNAFLVNGTKFFVPLLPFKPSGHDSSTKYYSQQVQILQLLRAVTNHKNSEVVQTFHEPVQFLSEASYC